MLYVSDDVPRVHNIRNVMARFADRLPNAVTDDQNNFFDNLTAFYLEGRYPEYMQIMNAQLDKEKAKALISQTKEIFAWLQTLKP